MQELDVTLNLGECPAHSTLKGCSQSVRVEPKMLRFDWPAEGWDAEVMHAVKRALQSSIRTAMSKSTSQQIRGSVVIEELSFGSEAPVIALSSIRELSAAHTAIVLSIKYAGDASITLRGLQINLDTTTVANERGEDPNHTVPFYCPFQMRITNLVIDGHVLVELSLSTEATLGVPSGGAAVALPTTAPSGGSGLVEHGAGPRCGTPPIEEMARRRERRVRSGCLLPLHVLQATRTAGRHPHKGFGGGLAPPSRGSSSGGLHSSRGVSPTLEPDLPAYADAMPPSLTSSFHGSTALYRRRLPGVGLLFGGGGRRAMRPPDAPISEASSPQRGALQTPLSTRFGTAPGPSFSSIGLTEPPHAQSAVAALRVTFADIAQKHARIAQSQVRVQLFGDPIKHFRVESNFSPVQGANAKVEEQLRNLLSPAIERLKTQGVAFNV